MLYVSNGRLKIRQPAAHTSSSNSPPPDHNPNHTLETVGQMTPAQLVAEVKDSVVDRHFARCTIAILEAEERLPAGYRPGGKGHSHPHDEGVRPLPRRLTQAPGLQEFLGVVPPGGRVF